MDVLDRHDTQNLQGMRETLKGIRSTVEAAAFQQRKDLEPHDWRAVGRITHALDIAEDAVFDVLNAAASYGGDTAAKEALR